MSILDERESFSKPQLCSRNLIQVINTLAVLTFDIIRTISEMNEESASTNGPEKNTLILMVHKALDPTNDLDRLFVSRKEGRIVQEIKIRSC